ncbi:ubiquitin-conjugating enzyme E2 U [Leptodactylus fuscus]|uniref:ubiquitin-conjugating enzyme E2 U n=1 Tax=Leptodactylus fuscus TaxID=238119 RepID=UPI003F4E968C
MHSRSYLLLEREYQELQEAGLYGISVTPISDNLLKWIAQVRGLKDSLWEGAVLQLTLTYPKEYNHHPPSVRFNTIPFHPNVEQTSGKPCIDFLDDPAGWSRSFTMTYILLVIQAMLSNPVLENSVNPEAAKMVANNSSLYREIVLNCVKASRQIEDGSVQESLVIRQTPALAPNPAPRKVKSVSFENYHKTWSEIGTSKTDREEKLKKYREQESRLFTKDMEDLRNGKKTYDVIIHGLLPRMRLEEEPHECALCRLSETANHLQKRHRGDSVMATYDAFARDGDPQEDEVEDLVAWTNTLSTEQLED